MGTGTQQPSFDGAGQGDPVEHGDDRSSAITEPGRLSKGTAGLCVIEARDIQHMCHLLGLAVVNGGGQSEQEPCGGDSSPHGGVAGLRPVAVEAHVPHAQLARSRMDGGLEHRPCPAILCCGVVRRPQVLRRRYPLAPMGSEAKRVDREMPAMCPAQEHPEREGRTGLAPPPGMSRQMAGTITGSDLGTPVDPQDWPKLAVVLGHVWRTHERPGWAGAAVVRE